MNDRERFTATMHYQPRDRAPIMDFSFWDETLPAWKSQGLPEETTLQNADYVFGMDGFERFWASFSSSAAYSENTKRSSLVGGGINVCLCPPFDKIVLEDRGDQELIQQADGVRVLEQKGASSVPAHEHHLLIDRESWKVHYKPKLDPHDPRRFPLDWEACVARWSSPDRDYPVFLPGGSLFGWLRNWLGLEGISYVAYDDPSWFQEMVETLADCVVAVLEKALATGVSFQGCGIWEDMCYNAGPLLSPAQFKRFLVPQYRRITDLLNKFGADVVWVDSDGDIRHLAPFWLEAGINCMFPIEVGTWNGDAVQYRREYGRDMLIMGGFDKTLLARGPAAIEDEVVRLTPLVEEGGFIPFCDHRVPPDVSLRNYLFYLRCARHNWGRETNLKPMHAVLEKLMLEGTLD